MVGIVNLNRCRFEGGGGKLRLTFLYDPALPIFGMFPVSFSFARFMFVGFNQLNVRCFGNSLLYNASYAW